MMDTSEQQSIPGKPKRNREEKNDTSSKVIRTSGESRGQVSRDVDMDIDEADWDRMHRVNSKGVFFAMQRAAQQMIEQGEGRIINMASIAGRGFSATSNAAYAASKGAVLAMTYVAAHQLGPKNINVNAICPGVTFTDLVYKLIEDRAEEQGRTVEEMREIFERPIPIRRGNDPSDVAALAVFLASPGARNITGQGYNVDGGLINS